MIVDEKSKLSNIEGVNLAIGDFVSSILLDTLTVGHNGDTLMTFSIGFNYLLLLFKAGHNPLF